MGEGEGGSLHPSLLGDVVISTEMAESEAQQRGVTLQQEIALLLVHGILHLLGYEHEDVPEEAAKMRTKEEEILVRLGLAGEHTEGL